MSTQRNVKVLSSHKIWTSQIPIKLHIMNHVGVCCHLKEYMDLKNKKRSLSLFMYLWSYSRRSSVEWQFKISLVHSEFQKTNTVVEINSNSSLLDHKQQINLSNSAQSALVIQRYLTKLWMLMSCLLKNLLNIESMWKHLAYLLLYHQVILL